ncbi:MAG: serine/threonine protein kinase [Chloroflexi bacterium]|nr:serine/threonine protein kinase [Chloroflexota bacterium]
MGISGCCAGYAIHIRWVIRVIGKTLQDRYVIEAELGKGGMGLVYRAHDLLLDRRVAIKVLSSANIGSEGRTRLLNEAQAAARLNHPNIVTIFDAGEVEKVPFIVMELINGQSLHDYRPENLEEIVRIARQILAALGHAHTHKIIHRDLKPENILITAEGVVKLMDFGLARSLASRISNEVLIVGTVYYLAPEMALGNPYDGRVDLYALGVILYELATRRLPFSADDPISVISQHLYAPVVPPSTYNPSIPSGLEGIILQLLIKDPNERPASANEVIKAFDILSALTPTQATATGAELSPIERLARGRLVGREREFSEARALWKKAASGSSQVLLISGEPGIGKTRLARELSTLVEVTGGRTLTGECYSEGGAPYAPVAQIVRRAVSTSRDSDPEITPWNIRRLPNLSQLVLAALIQLSPELQDVYPAVPPNPPLDPQAEQQRLHESLFSLCSALCSQNPLLLVIEDAHWADSGSLRAVRHLARRSTSANLPLMILLTYREVELDHAHPLKDLLFDLNRERLGTRIKLARLSWEDTRLMLQSLLQEQIAPELVNSIYQETEGNPFFIEEVCKALVEQGSLVLENGHWRSSDNLERVQIPQSVRLAIETRAEQLSAQTQDALLIASVIGREFDFDILLKASERDEESLIAALEEAEHAQLVVEVKSKPGEERFAFTHALVPTTLREGASGLRRHRLHRRVAEAIESLNPDDYPALAYHYDQAGDEDCALSYYSKAAERSRQVYANDEAIRYYTQALDLAEPDSATTFDLLAGRMRVYELVGQRDEQTADIRQMLKLAEKLDDPLRRFDAQIAQLDLDFATNALQMAPLAKQVVDGARKIGDPAREGQALLRYGEAERTLGRLPEARSAFEAAAEQFHKANLPAQEAESYHTLALVYDASGDAQTGQKYAEKALQLSRSAGDRKQEATSLRRLGLLHTDQRHFTQAETLLREALVLHRALGDRSEESNALAILAEILTNLGRFNEAEKFALQSQEVSVAIQSYAGLVRAVRRQLEIYRHFGKFEAGLRLVEEQYSHCCLDPNDLLVTNLDAMKSGLLNDLGQYERALEAAQYLIAYVDKLDSERVWADVYTYIAWLHMNLNQLDTAEDILQKALPRAESSSEPWVLLETLLIIGELALRQGSQANLNSGLLSVQRALPLCIQTSHKSNQVNALSLAARLCLQLGQTEQALMHSSEAVQISGEVASAYQSESYLYTHALSLQANGQTTTAKDFLRLAHSRVMQVASQTQDPALHQSWLENVPINRSIQHEWELWGLTD